MVKCWFFLLPLTIVWADFGVQNQVELHAKYQNLAFELQDVVVYARLDSATALPQNWQLYLRLDIPYMWLWGKQQELISIGEDGIVVAPETEGAQTKVKMTPLREQGLADLLTRAFFVTPALDEAKRVTVGFGSELTFPTAQEPDLGTGKYAARPMAGVKWDFPQLGIGSWLAFLCKYEFSFAGHKDRSSFQILYLQPVFVYGFGKDWALVLSPEAQYDVREKKWFIPAAINLTKGFGRHFSCSVSYQRGLVTAFPVFQDEAELILRYIF